MVGILKRKPSGIGEAGYWAALNNLLPNLKLNQQPANSRVNAVATAILNLAHRGSSAQPGYKHFFNLNEFENSKEIEKSENLIEFLVLV